MKVFYLLFFIIVILMGASFAAINSTVVQLNYYFGEIYLPLSLLMFINLSIGGLLGIIASMGLIMKTLCENRKLKKQAKLKEQEIANLRTLPLQSNDR